MIIYSDFSDTIAKPKHFDKFPPFELELGKLMESAVESKEREQFRSSYTQGYKKFTEIRRDNTIPFSERAHTWLQPFTNLLTIEHIQKLVADFDLNTNFVKFTHLIKKTLGVEKLQATIVSGTLTQVIREFLDRPDIADELEHIEFSILATDLIMNKDGVFTGEIASTDELVYKGNFPDDCLIIGDNPMENYGFGDKLVNVQDYSFEKSEATLNSLIQKSSQHRS